MGSSASYRANGAMGSEGVWQNSLALFGMTGQDRQGYADFF
jgi:hypothetical protein